jgi:hypothetical protein
MPKFFEVYGCLTDTTNKTELENRKRAYCPFTCATCDGGGNRHQTKINLKNSPLRNFFDQSLDSVIPGVCSIEYSGEIWIVCPRRLLGFNPPDEHRKTINHSLQPHEEKALIKAGLPRGVELGIWSEVYLQYGDEDSSINYHFDFVITELYRNKSFNSLLDDYPGLSNDEKLELLKSARKGKFISGRYSESSPIDLLPNLNSPTIIEVMTASTSGSDTEAGTDIASSFTKAMLGQEYDCPGINKRQVWGRMATQLFAKSALAEKWGGKTVWLVQDQLLDNIALTTQLTLNEIKDSKSSAINFLSMKFKPGHQNVNDRLTFGEFTQKEAGLVFSGSKTCTGILLPKTYPKKAELLKSVIRREISNIIKL